MKKIGSVFIFLVFMLCINNITAHPWGGLAVDQQGNIYFTFTSPFVDDGHFACVWLINNKQELNEFLESSHSPSDIILSRTANRIIYAAERNNAGSRLQARLWKLSKSDKEIIIQPTTNEEEFFIQAYAVDDGGTVYFSRENRLFKKEIDGSVSEVSLKAEIERFDDLAWGANGKLYILDRGSIKILEENGTVTTVVNGLKEDNPDNLPFSGANILFDFSVDDQGNIYVAYYGNRRVLKVTAEGNVSVFLQSEGPWAPHGVDVFEGEVYVLESTFGTSKWWKFWEEDVIIPRIRKVDTYGNVSTLFEYDMEK